MAKINLLEVISAISNNSIQLILSSLVVYVIIIVINYAKQKYYSKLKPQDFDIEDDLTTHPVFSRTNYLLNQVDYTLEFGAGRSKLITDIITKKFNIANDELFKFAKELTKRKRNEENVDVHALHMKHYNRMVKRYTNVDNYNVSRDDKRALQIALLEFQKWHKERSEVLRQMSEDISKTKFYKTDTARGFAILNTHMTIMIDILHDAGKTLREINGRLSDETYKGVELK